MEITNREGRLDDLEALPDDIESMVSFCKDKLASFKGRLLFATNHVFGKCAQICAQLISRTTQCFEGSNSHSMWIGASLDKLGLQSSPQASKSVPSESGALFLGFAHKLYGYVVCHFGARFSAYWWQRLGALLLRRAHHLPAAKLHNAWLCVGDLLVNLLHSGGDL